MAAAVNALLDAVREQAAAAHAERDLDLALVRETPNGLLVTDAQGLVRRANPALDSADPAFHARLGTSRPHHRGIGTPTNQQADRLDEHRLPRTGLASERREAATEHKIEPVDHPERFDVEFVEHQRSVSPNFAFRI